MTKAIKIKEFVISRIAEIDEQYSSTSDNMEKLKYSTMRTSFANVSYKLSRFSTLISTNKDN